MNTRLRFMAVISCACCLGAAWLVKAQQGQTAGASGITPILPANPTTRANAPERVRAALEAARQAEAKNDQEFINSPEVTRLREVPIITLPLLAPYAVHPSSYVRDIVYMVASDALSGESMLSQPVDENTRDLAMRLLAQVATLRSVYAPAAVESLYNLVLDGSLPGRSEPPDLTARYARAGVKRGVMRYIENSGSDEIAAALLSLFKDDAEVGRFLARAAKQQHYPFAFSLALTQWGDGNALEAVESESKVMEPQELAAVVGRARFIDNPKVLRLLASHLDDKRQTFAIGAAPSDANMTSITRRVCDHVSAALRIKLEGAKINLRAPDIATDEELAAAKARFAPLIDALPIPNAPPA